MSDRPMRSLIEPVGFWFSSLTKSRHGPVSNRVSSTSGVLPIESSTLRWTTMAPPPARSARREVPSYAGSRKPARPPGLRLPAVGQRTLIGRTLDELVVDGDVVLHHARDREAAQEGAADGGAVEAVEAAERINRAGDVLDDIAADTLIDDFRHRAAAVSHNRRAARHRLDHRQAERLRPVDREDQRPGADEQPVLV